ncbi:MAG: hypothetical protein ACXIVL_08745 [Oceanicaulis sp.]
MTDKPSSDRPPAGPGSALAPAAGPGPASWRAAASAPRAAGLAGASLLHVMALAGLIALPPVVTWPEPALQAPGQGAFYIFLAEGADSDAPLFEPPLAPVDGDPDGASGGGEGSGSSDGDAAGAESDTGAEADLEPEAEITPETETDTPSDPADDPETASDDPETAPDDPIGVVLELMESGDRPVDSAPRPAPSAADRTPSIPAPAPDPADADAPVATLQPRRAEPGGARGEPELDIDALMAQMAISLDPDDYRMIQGAVASRLVVRDSFCLSSSDANREAGNCPEDAPASDIDLAQFGLTGFGATPPRFLEDMSRLEFELAQMGAGGSQIRRIMTGLADARRTVISQPAVTREMNRIAGDRTDAQGFRAPITPQRARDPSGEP